MKGLRVGMIVALSLSAGTALIAQRPGRPMGGRGQGAAQDPRRAELEDEVRRGFARAVRERVGLTDQQMLKLGPLTRRYEEQRRQAQMDERDARMKLQALVLVGSDADSVRLKQFMAQLNDVRKRRVQIDEAEQKDLATIMSPLQMAKFLGIQEQVRRRLEQMRPFPGGQPGEMPPGAQRPGQGDGGGMPPGDSVFVRFNIMPFSTRILIDSVEQGMGRTRLKVSLGSHRVTLSAPGCKSEEQMIEARIGPEAVVSKTLSCQ